MKRFDSAAVGPFMGLDLHFLGLVLGWASCGVVPCAIGGILGAQHQHPMRKLRAALQPEGNFNVDGDIQVKRHSLYGLDNVME